MQHGEAAFGLGAQVVTDGQVDRLTGHVRHVETGEQPQVDFRAALMEVGQARQ
ncbi:hypothetical protein D3C80_2238770 [compost metagenome]